MCIVNNGMGRFGRASVLVIVGSAAKALAALLFAHAGLAQTDLLSWSVFYFAANAGSALLGIVLFYPRQRLRWRPALYLRRLGDSLAVAGAEILFYLQSEMDKLLVLSLGGPAIAGIYAMLMRLIDLTALPVRSFNMMIVQKLIRTPGLLQSWRRRWMTEGGIALVSVAGMGALGLILAVAPTLLGRNVADAAPLVLLVLLVPAFRNLVEYQSELLYARGRTGMRAAILALLGLLKAGFLTLLLQGAATTPDDQWILGLNGVFAALWIASAGPPISRSTGAAACRATARPAPPTSQRRDRAISEPVKVPGGGSARDFRHSRGAERSRCRRHRRGSATKWVAKSTAEPTRRTFRTSS